MHGTHFRQIQQQRSEDSHIVSFLGRGEIIELKSTKFNNFTDQLIHHTLRSCYQASAAMNVLKQCAFIMAACMLVHTAAGQSCDQEFCAQVIVCGELLVTTYHLECLFSSAYSSVALHSCV